MRQLLVVLPLLLVIGCGSKNQQSDVTLGPLGSPSGGGARDEVKDSLPKSDQEVIRKIEALEKNLRSFLRDSGVAQVHTTLPALAQPVFRDKNDKTIDLSVDQPLIIGPHTLASSYIRMLDKIADIPDESVKNWLLEGAGGPFEPMGDSDISNERERKTLKIAQGILGLGRGMDRWLDALGSRAHHVSQEKYDTRVYFKVRNSECSTTTVKRGKGLGITHCLKDLLRFWDRYNEFPQEKQIVKESILFVCNQLEGLDFSCSDAWAQKEESEELQQFYLDIEKKFKTSMRMRFFSVRNEGVKFGCKKSESGTTINLHLNIQTDDPVIKRLARLGTAWYWNEKNLLRIIPKFKDEFPAGTKALKVDFVSGPFSHVNRANPLTIKLAQKYRDNGSMREAARTFAHELGHVFGLPDCYHQFIESNSNNLIYYEIEQNNLMCSIQRNVRMTKRSIREIIRKKCEFEE